MRITDTLEIYPMVSGQRGLPGESAVIDMTVIAPIIEDILAVAPTWNTIPDQTFTVNTAASFDVSDYVATGEVITYSATGLPSGLSINSLTGVISGTPDTSGMETVTVTASNAGGSAETTFDVTVASGVLTSAVFTRVGTYTLSSETQGFAGSGTTLYYVYDTGSGTYVRGINPESGVQTFLSEFESQADRPRGLAIVGDNAFFNDEDNNDVYRCNLTTGVITRLAQGSSQNRTNGFASDGTTLYILDGSSSQTQRVSTVNQTTGALGTAHTLTGYNSADSTAVRAFTYIDGNFYVATLDFSSGDPYLYTLDVSNGQLTEIGPISPDNSNFDHFGAVGNYIYAFNSDDDGVYRTGS